jgi:hypothetical protein
MKMTQLTNHRGLLALQTVHNVILTFMLLKKTPLETKKRKPLNKESLSIDHNQTLKSKLHHVTIQSKRRTKT